MSHLLLSSHSVSTSPLPLYPSLPSVCSESRAPPSTPRPAPTIPFEERGKAQQPAPPMDSAENIEETESGSGESPGGAADERSVVVNDLLCFITNYEGRVSDERLLELVGSHFNRSAVENAREELSALVSESAEPSSPSSSTEDGPPTPDIVRSLVTSLHEHPDPRAVFAATDLHALPLALEDDLDDKVRDPHPDADLLLQILGEVQTLKRSVEELRFEQLNSGKRLLTSDAAALFNSTPIQPPRPAHFDSTHTSDEKTSDSSDNSSLLNASKRSLLSPSTNTLETTVQRLRERHSQPDTTQPTESPDAQRRPKPDLAALFRPPTLPQGSPLTRENAVALHNWYTWLNIAQQQHKARSRPAWAGSSYPGFPSSPLPPLAIQTQMPFQPFARLPGISPFRPTASLADTSPAPIDLSPLTSKSGGQDEVKTESDEIRDSPTNSTLTSPSDLSTRNRNDRILDGAYKPWVCRYHPSCKKSFGTKFLRKKHENIHTGEKPHQCPYCGKRFNRKDNLLRHKKTHIANAMAGNQRRRHTLVFGVPPVSLASPLSSIIQ